MQTFMYWQCTSQTPGSQASWLLQDLQSLPLPVFLHEPTTELMKAAEDVEHSHLLDEARGLSSLAHLHSITPLASRHGAHIPPGRAEFLAPAGIISACSERPCRDHAGRSMC